MIEEYLQNTMLQIGKQELHIMTLNWLFRIDSRRNLSWIMIIHIMQVKVIWI